MLMLLGNWHELRIVSIDEGCSVQSYKDKRVKYWLLLCDIFSRRNALSKPFSDKSASSLEHELCEIVSSLVESNVVVFDTGGYEC